MDKRRYALAFFICSSFFMVLGLPYARADFQILDAIKEFGEKRFLDVPPARLKLGPVRVHPSLRTKIEYDSNIFLEDQDEKQDFIFSVLPGIILDLPINKHRIAVGYEADMEFFGKERHRSQNDQNQNMFALVNLHFPSWYVNVLERFTETSGRSGTTFTSRIPRYDQSIHPKIGYRWNRLTFELGFRHFYRDFRRQVDDSLDFQLAEWTGVIFLDLFARLKALLEYQIAQIDYDDNASRQGTFNQVRVGLEGEIRPNLTVIARVGPQFRNYEFDSEEDFNSWVADLRVDYDIRPNLSVFAGYTRKAVEATFGNVNYYEQNLIEFGVNYNLRPNIELFGKTRMYRQDYSERATVGTQTGFRRDRNLKLILGTTYEPRDWLEFTLKYEYARRHSNFSTFDYNDHRVSLTTGVVY
jgi:hypothetical protein